MLTLLAVVAAASAPNNGPGGPIEPCTKPLSCPAGCVCRKQDHYQACFKPPVTQGHEILCDREDVAEETSAVDLTGMETTPPPPDEDPLGWDCSLGEDSPAGFDVMGKCIEKGYACLSFQKKGVPEKYDQRVQICVDDKEVGQEAGQACGQKESECSCGRDGGYALCNPGFSVLAAPKHKCFCAIEWGPALDSAAPEDATPPTEQCTKPLSCPAGCVCRKQAHYQACFKEPVTQGHEILCDREEAVEAPAITVQRIVLQNQLDPGDDKRQTVDLTKGDRFIVVLPSAAMWGYHLIGPMDVKVVNRTVHVRHEVVGQPGVYTYELQTLQSSGSAVFKYYYPGLPDNFGEFHVVWPAAQELGQQVAAALPPMRHCQPDGEPLCSGLGEAQCKARGPPRGDCQWVDTAAPIFV